MPIKMSDFAKQVYACFACIGEKEIQVFPHARVDGDCVGSAVTLAMALRKLGLPSRVMLECEIPPRLSFMHVPEDVLCIVSEKNQKACEESQGIAFAVDCSEGHRMGACEVLFEKAQTKIVIDHHISAEPDLKYAYVDPKSASTAELIYNFLRELEEITEVTLLDAFAANCLMVGIQSDSGRFSFENTGAVTFRIAADLMELGANVADNAYYLFDESSKGKVLLHGMALSNMSLYADDRIAITKITNKMVEETGAPEGAADGIANLLRDIDTVLAAFVVRESEDGSLRVNCRSKEGFDAAAFAQTMGGGGHHRASGFTGRNVAIDDFVKEIIEKAQAWLEKHE